MEVSWMANIIYLNLKDRLLDLFPRTRKIMYLSLKDLLLNLVSRTRKKRMESMQEELTDEAGIYSMGIEQIVVDVLGPCSKGWECMHGRTSAKKKMKALTQYVIEKIQTGTRQQVMIQLADQVAQQIEEATRKAREEAQKLMEDAIQRTITRMLSQLPPTSSSSQQVLYN